MRPLVSRAAHDAIGEARWRLLSAQRVAEFVFEICHRPTFPNTLVAFSRSMASDRWS
jgi:hypothetical protein